MNDLQKKQLEFLEDTISYYSEDTNRRCIGVKNRYFYSPENANKIGISDGCAIGRHLTPELKLELDKGKIVSVNHHTVFKKLPENLQELEAIFLRKVQNLHDRSGYWQDGEGLTIIGENYVKNMKNYFNLVP